MNPSLIDPKLIVLAAVLILVIAGLAWLYMRKRKTTTANLRQRFGTEYERVVQQHGSERRAEAKLADREKRVEQFHIRDLDPIERDRFSQQWAAGAVSFCRFPQRRSHRSRRSGVL